MKFYELFLLLWAFHGWIGLSYSNLAEKRSWPKLAVFDPHGSNLDAISKSSFVQVPFSIGLAWISEGLISLLLILLGSYFMALLATELLRSSVQWVWITLYLVWLGAIPLVYYFN